VSEFDQKEALLQRIKAAKEKSSQFEIDACEKEELRELEKKAQFEENKLRDLPHIQKAEDEHGEIRVVNTRLGAIIVKRPHHLVFQKFSRRAGSKKGLDDAAIWGLVRPCIVYPEIEKVNEITETYPGVTAKLGEKVIELGNGDVEEFEGK
jgi:hypothetical protein